MGSELYLFVIWEKARPHAEKIVADIARHMEVLAVLNQSWPTDTRRAKILRHLLSLPGRVSNQDSV